MKIICFKDSKIVLLVLAIVSLLFSFSGCNSKFYKNQEFDFFQNGSDAQSASSEKKDRPSTGNKQQSVEKSKNPNPGESAKAGAVPPGQRALSGANKKASKPKKPPVQEILDEALDFCKVSQDLWQKGELDNAIQAL